MERAIPVQVNASFFSTLVHAFDCGSHTRHDLCSTSARRTDFGKPFTYSGLDESRTLFGMFELSSVRKIEEQPAILDNAGRLRLLAFQQTAEIRNEAKELITVRVS